MESYQDYTEPKQSNTLGLVGFILSFTCCLSPLALLLCLIAVMKPPRGLAIAGLLISGLITAGLFQGYMKLDTIAKENKLDGIGNAMEYTLDGLMLTNALQQFIIGKGELPTGIDDLVAETDAKTDPWGNAYRLSSRGFRSSVNDQGNEVRIAIFGLESAGVDGKWDTEDDIIPGDDIEKVVGFVMVQVPETFGEDAEEPTPDEDEAGDPAVIPAVEENK